MWPEITIAVGIFTGCLCRALFPFFKKKYHAADRGEDIRWESRYIWTLVFAILASFVTTTFLLPMFELPAVPATSMFPYAFTFGWASQDIVNMMVK